MVFNKGMSQAAIHRAVEIAGGQSALARKVGARQQEIWNWLNGRPIPDHRRPAIERETGVAVEDLGNGDVHWQRVPDPDWPHPAGRPCIDVARSTPTTNQQETRDAA